MTILVFYSSITQIIRQQKLNTNAKLNKKDKFNRYAIDDDKNAKYNPNIELNKQAKQRGISIIIIFIVESVVVKSNK